MTNESIAAVLEHLCNEARNSMHATFGVMELLRDVSSDPSHRSAAAIGRASADQLLRSIDDVRELVSSVGPAPVLIEKFDVVLQAGEIIEVLNMASKRRRRHMELDSPAGTLLITQDRSGMERLLTRILDAAFKLTQVTDVHIKLAASPEKQGALMTIQARDSVLAEHLIQWLNSNPNDAALSNPEDVPFAIAVMVAGKRLRAMGGWAELERSADGHAAVTLVLPSAVQVGESVGLGQEPQPDALNVLVAEDCDDSFVLSELVLGDEQVKRARDGAEAIRMVQKQRFDVVLMDVHMPGMDGYTVIRSMRDWETETGNARVPIVVLSSDDLDTQRRAAAQCGCSGFLRKPLRRSDLLDLLDRLKQARMPAA